MNKQKISSIAVVLIVYLLGLVSGSLATRIGTKRFFMHGMKYSGKFEEKCESRIAKRLSSKLRLSDEQKDQVKIIAENHRPEMKKMRQSMRGKMKEFKDKMEIDIRSILNDEQTIKFDKIIKNHEKFHGRKQSKRSGLRRQGMRRGVKDDNQ